MGIFKKLGELLGITKVDKSNNNEKKVQKQKTQSNLSKEEMKKIHKQIKQKEKQIANTKEMLGQGYLPEEKVLEKREEIKEYEKELQKLKAKR
ncbi:MAG: hypothetical protein ACOCV1_03770 [Bacillota bacterium]